METTEIKKIVRARYANIATGAVTDCCAPSC